MHTELRDQNNRLLGRVVLNPEGVAEMEDGSIIHGEMLGETNMILPGPRLVQTD